VSGDFPVPHAGGGLAGVLGISDLKFEIENLELQIRNLNSKISKLKFRIEQAWPSWLLGTDRRRGSSR
jgi:hypothetical protein